MPREEEGVVEKTQTPFPVGVWGSHSIVTGRDRMGGPAACRLCRTEKKSDLILDLKLVGELQLLSCACCL